MSIDLLSEQTLTLEEVGNHVPKRRGRKISRSTVFRWVSRGCSGIALETVMVGGIRHTSQEALRRFFDEVTALRAGSRKGVHGRSPAQRNRAAEAARRKLEKLGV